jgi:putative membrane protein
VNLSPTTDHRPRWASLVAVLLLPLLAAGLGLWSLRDRPERIETVPAAVVNLDEGTMMEVDGEQTIVPLGRSLAGALASPETADTGDRATDTGLDWVLTSEDDAAAGVLDGTYAVVVTIPADFSDQVATLGTVEAVPALLEVTTDSSDQLLLAELGGQTAEAAGDAFGDVLGEEMISAMLSGTADLREGLDEAATGAEELSAGTEELATGLDDAATGASDMAEGVGLLADGTEEVATGTDELSGGVDLLAGGAGDLATGLGDLATGTRTTADGAQLAADGMEELSVGADALATGADDLATGVDALATGTGELSSGADELADGVSLLDVALNGEGTTPGLAGGVSELRGGVDSLVGTTDLDALATDTTAALGALDRAVDGDQLRNALEEMLLTSRELLALVEAAETAGAAVGDSSETLDGLADRCLGAGGDEAFCTDLAVAATEVADAVGTPAVPEGTTDELRLLVEGDGTAENPGLAGLAASLDGLSDEGLEADLDEISTQLEDLVVGLPGVVDGIRQIDDGLSATANGAAELSNGADALATGVEELDTGVGELATGAGDLAAGASALAGGVDQAATGSQDLADGLFLLADGVDAAALGAGELEDGARLTADGAAQLADGTDDLAAGAGEAADGADLLAEGSDQIAAGGDELADGADELATGLREAADAVPDHTDEEIEQMAAVGVQPVDTSWSRLAATDSTATGAFSLLAPLALWLGALVLLLVRPAFTRAALAAPGGAVAVALRSFAPSLGLAAAQAVLVGLVSAALGVRIEHPGQVALVIGAVTLAVVALHQALRALLGPVGATVASLVLLVVQLAVLPGLLPASTAPAPLAAAAGALPVPIAVDALLEGVLGGTGSVLGAVGALVLWAAIGVLLTAARAGAARRQEFSAA